jgi:glycine dehydrogenase subunit 1
VSPHIAPYTPQTEADVEAMLAAIGAPSLAELVRVPAALAPKKPLDLPQALPEVELVRTMEELAGRNAGAGLVSFLGVGAYHHYIPPVVMQLAMRGEFVTAYTPYQAEVSQGYLQAIYEWQTYVSLLTGMDLANASVYDGATATAESAIMALNATGRRALLVSQGLHPSYRAVLQTYADGLNLDIEDIPLSAAGTTDLSALDARLADGRFAALILQSPNFLGCIDTPGEAVRAVLEKSNTLLIGVVAEALSLAALAPPSTWGAQIVAGEAQSFGVPLSYGGPYLGFVATTTEHMRRIPGRLVGRTVDSEGKTAYVLTLQAREQHIRRERASSNICTNQAHCALIATIYLAALGASGLRECAALNLARSAEVTAKLSALPGFSRAFAAPSFNETAIRLPAGCKASDVLDALAERGLLGGVDLGRWYPELDDCILVCATELTSGAEIAALSSALAEIAAQRRETVAAR